jgi:selenocysteine lyase/cysteine desulfurase
MSLGRRDFLIGTGALAAAVRPTLAALQPGKPGAVFPATIRADFPGAAVETYLNSAAIHPLGAFAVQAVEQTMAFRVRGAGPGRADFGVEKQNHLKARFAAMIGARPTEIAFVSSTSDGENIVALGLDLPAKKGNVVLDELHFTSSLYLFKELEKKGVELRIIEHRNWAIDVKDMERAIDKDTRLVSMAMVSNVNGFMHDVKAVSEIAHARGAYVFADLIQAVGAVPVNVREMGIDFASTGTYKWLMGERGFGFLYVREDLQGSVLPTTRYGHRQVSNFNRAALTWDPVPGAAMYESGNIPILLAAAVSAGIDYVTMLGLDKIRAHAKALTDRLQTELPKLGYRSLTPHNTATPIVAFELTDPGATAKALQASRIAATIIANESRLRLSVSVFNNHEDVDRVIAALAGKRPVSA